MVDKKKLALSRRQALGGLGAIGLASAGAGLGTTALFSDEESFTGNLLSAGTLDLVVDYYTSRDQGDFNSDSQSGTVNGNQAATYTYDVSDVKPGDSGTLAFCPKVDGNPGYVWVGSEDGITDYENGQTEPEGGVDATGGGSLGSPNDGPGAGELGDSIEVTVSYAESITYDANNNEITCNNTRELNNPSGYTLADLANDLESGFPLDGDEPNGDGAFDAYPSTGANEEGPCLCIEWEVPTDVGNEIQSDAIELGFRFEAEQERNNDNPDNPFVDITVGTGGGFDFNSIQAAVDAASPGDVISVASGTYNEQVTIDKSVILVAASQPKIRPPSTNPSPNYQAGFNLNADDVMLQGFNVEEFNTGLRVRKPNDVQGLYIDNCSFDNNRFGLYAHNDPNSNPQGPGAPSGAVGMSGITSTFDDVVIKNTSFNGNDDKGIYVERLSNALFDNIEIRNSGVDFFAPNGLDINLKYGDYANITVKNSTFYESGLVTSQTVNADLAAALTVKARGSGNDTSYNGNSSDDSYEVVDTNDAPATVDNVVVENNEFEFTSSTQGESWDATAINAGEPFGANLEEPTPGDDNDGDGFDDITIAGNSYTNVDIQVRDLTQ